MEYKNSKTANRRRYKSRYHSPHNYKTKPSSSGYRAPILIGIATFLVLASLVLVFTFGDSIYTFLDNTFHPSVLPLPASETMGVVPVTEAETQVPTAAEPLPTQAPIAQSNEFSRLLSAAGLSADSLGGTQMVFVESAGTSARVYTYEKGDDGVWTPKFDAMKGFVGTGGVAAAVGPYDDTTPAGTYRVEYAFGTNMDPGTALTYYGVEYGMRWITDPASMNYNRLMAPDATYVDWNECQWLHEYTKSYPYAIVFDYNRDPVDPSQGCARFLHVAEAPTYGGVGIAESDLRNILLWLDPSANPTISIF